MKSKLLLAILMLFSISESICGGDEKYLSNRIPHLIKILNELQEYTKSSIDIKLDDHENKDKSNRFLASVTLIVNKADSIELQKELAILVWHIGTFENVSWDEDPSPRVYLTAFDIITKKIAEDTSEDAVKAMQSIANRIQLDAGEFQKFNERKVRQLKNRGDGGR